MRRHDTYCSNFSCTPVTLAVGLRPGARRAMGLPSNRSRPVTNSAVPSGRPLPSASRDPQNPDLESSIAIQQSAGCDQAQREPSLIHHLRHLYVL
jgi:hypothetical protein